LALAFIITMFLTPELHKAAAAGSGTIGTLPQYVETKNEGSSISTKTKSYNFVGSGVNATNSSNAITVTIPGSTGGTWGGITGTLSDQTDLQSALDAKQPLDSDLTTNLRTHGDD
jgi:hypothetical protein